MQSIKWEVKKKISDWFYWVDLTWNFFLSPISHIYWIVYNVTLIDALVQGPWTLPNCTLNSYICYSCWWHVCSDPVVNCHHILVLVLAYYCFISRMSGLCSLPNSFHWAQRCIEIKLGKRELIRTMNVARPWDWIGLGRSPGLTVRLMAELTALPLLIALSTHSVPTSCRSHRDPL